MTTTTKSKKSGRKPTPSRTAAIKAWAEAIKASKAFRASLMAFRAALDACPPNVRERLLPARDTARGLDWIEMTATHLEEELEFGGYAPRAVSVLAGDFTAEHIAEGLGDSYGEDALRTYVASSIVPLMANEGLDFDAEAFLAAAAPSPEEAIAGVA